MIIDSTVLKELIFGNNSKYQKIRKKFEGGELTIRIPDVVKYDVFKTIINENIPEEHFTKLVELIVRYLEYLTVNLDHTHITDAISISRDLKVDFSVAACLVLANSLMDVYVTANRELVEKLRKNGYSVLHINEIL
ncbi:hypothetical protein DRN86_04575 [Candidatus Geothermarchaeota archaeon]|nr:MAG: hypothetical protein DRN86_04575 [Candidatus Geothermarchaeota archaeon]